ncbi:MAG: ABC transporter permease [Bacteroidaceae bacterium]|nr:ABC transporter permease [Bacteroidaceae bacterium]
MKGKNKQSIEHTAQQKEAHKAVLFEAGKFCLDIAKLVFAGVIIAGLVKQDIDYSLQFTLGILAVGVFCFYGFLLIHSSK